MHLRATAWRSGRFHRPHFGALMQAVDNTSRRASDASGCEIDANSGQIVYITRPRGRTFSELTLSPNADTLATPSGKLSFLMSANECEADCQLIAAFKSNSIRPGARNTLRRTLPALLRKPK